MAKKKYYSYTKKIKGKTYYYNQDGKRISKEKAIRSKRPIYVMANYGTHKGELIIPEKKKVKKTTAPKIKDTINQFWIKNVEISREINRAIEKGLKMYLTVTETVFLQSNESKANLSLFNYSVNQKFYSTIGKLIDSPFFDILILEKREKNLILFDYSKPNVESYGDKNEESEISKAANLFIKEIKKLFRKFFKL